MNASLHPSGHWFHHQHLQKADEHLGGIRWSKVFHSEAFLIFVLLAAVWIPLIVLAVLVGEPRQSNTTPPAFYGPLW